MNDIPAYTLVDTWIRLLLARQVSKGFGKKPPNIACTRTGELGLF